MRIFLILVVVFLVLMFFGESAEDKDYRMAVESFSSPSPFFTGAEVEVEESYSFYDFVWDAVSLIFKGSILGILLLIGKYFYNNE